MELNLYAKYGQYMWNMISRSEMPFHQRGNFA